MHQQTCKQRTARLARLLVVTALLAGLPAAASAAPAGSGKPHAGQFCKPHRKAPKGFKCVKTKGGKYRLVKSS